MNNLQKGDYVLATKWTDGDPQDPWAIGFYSGEIANNISTRHMGVDSEGKPFRPSGFRRVQKISAGLGKWILDNKDDIELGGRSLWDIATNNSDRTGNRQPGRLAGQIIISDDFDAKAQTNDG